MREGMPSFMKEAGKVGIIAAGLAGEALAQEMPETNREEAATVAYRHVENNRDSLNMEYKPTPKDGGVIELQSSRNDTLDREGRSVANAPEMQLELHGETWRMVPKSDSFDWLAKESGLKFDGFIVDPASKDALNAAINAVIATDAVLDRYMNSAKAEQPADSALSDDPFATMLESKYQDSAETAATQDAIAYLKTTPFFAE